MSRVIFECNSFNVSPPRLDVFTLTDALIGFIGGLTGAVVVVEQRDFCNNAEKVRMVFALSFLTYGNIDILIFSMGWQRCNKVV